MPRRIYFEGRIEDTGMDGGEASLTVGLLSSYLDGLEDAGKISDSSVEYNRGNIAAELQKLGYKPADNSLLAAATLVDSRFRGTLSRRLLERFGLKELVIKRLERWDR